MPPSTPGRSSPVQPVPVDSHAPMPSRTASYFSRRVSNVISIPTRVLGTIFTPMRAMVSISSSSTALGRRYSGIPYRSIPPSLGMASKMVTPWPFWRRK